MGPEEESLDEVENLGWFENKKLWVEGKDL